MTSLSCHRGKCKSEEGSALPLFIAAAAFLALLGASFIGSLQLLQDQRRLNGVSDAVALSLAQQLEQVSVANDIQNKAGSEMRLIYPNARAEVKRAELTGPKTIDVELCENSGPTLASMLGMVSAKVCAHSRATQK